MTNKRLTLSNDNVFGGVCGGISEYFDIDPVFLRVIWAISFFVYGWGLLLYFIMYCAMPEKEKWNLK